MQEEAGVGAIFPGWENHADRKRAGPRETAYQEIPAPGRRKSRTLLLHRQVVILAPDQVGGKFQRASAIQKMPDPRLTGNDRHGPGTAMQRS